jgi:hypothetical protein
VEGIGTLNPTARHDTTGMDSMRHDLRTALDEVPPKAIQASADRRTPPKNEALQVR